MKEIDLDNSAEGKVLAKNDDCRKILEKRFSEPPEGKMMGALFDAILEDMVNREIS